MTHEQRTTQWPPAPSPRTPRTIRWRRSSPSTRSKWCAAKACGCSSPTGRRVLDLYGGHAVAALGYGHPAWTRALSEQARAVNFQSNAVPMDVRTRAANKLIAFSRLPVESVFFINSGAEANENALKMAFTLNPGRTEVVALEQSFHGRTAAAGALTWGAAKKWYGFPRTPFDVKFLPRRDVAALDAASPKRPPRWWSSPCRAWVAPSISAPTT